MEAAEQLFRIAFWVLFGFLLLIRSTSAIRVHLSGERLTPDRKSIEREGKGLFIGRIIAFLFLLSILVLYAIDSPLLKALSIQLPDFLRWSGAAISFASLMLWAWAQAALGRQWSTNLQLRRKHLLVATGPYARIRHPIYSAMLGWGLGVSLLTANILFVLLTIAMAIGILIRVPKEEQMMVAEFGKEYENYIGMTGRFFPRLR